MQFEVYTDKAGEYRWRLKAPNGNIIADSGEGYKNRTDCLDIIATIQKQAATAAITAP